MLHYFISDQGGFAEGTGLYEPPGPGWNEVTHEEYQAAQVVSEAEQLVWCP